MKVKNKYDCTREDRDNYVKANVTGNLLFKKTEDKQPAGLKPQFMGSSLFLCQSSWPQNGENAGVV